MMPLEKEAVRLQLEVATALQHPAARLIPVGVVDVLHSLMLLVRRLAVEIETLKGEKHG